MPKRLKTNVRLDNGEACVVASMEFWSHIIYTYRRLAEELENAPDKDAWNGVADHIEKWVDDTVYYADSDEDEDW